MSGTISRKSRILAPSRSVIVNRLSITENRWAILLMLNILLLIWGMLMDSLPAILILVPILYPLARALGINSVHFGVVVTFNLALGLITPPYGAALFTGSIVSGLSIEKIVREMLPFIIASICILFIITYIPIIVTWLPEVFRNIAKGYCLGTRGNSMQLRDGHSSSARLVIARGDQHSLPEGEDQR